MRGTRLWTLGVPTQHHPQLIDLFAFVTAGPMDIRHAETGLGRNSTPDGFETLHVADGFRIPLERHKTVRHAPGGVGLPIRRLIGLNRLFEATQFTQQLCFRPEQTLTSIFGILLQRRNLRQRLLLEGAVLVRPAK
jgi:hypothetical protein